MRYPMLIVFLFTLLQPAAQAYERPIGHGLWQLAEATRQGRLSLSEAADLVQKRLGGRILAAQAVREQGRDVYRIKVLTRQGEVRIVLVDAATGNME
mgnify:CR=1 FL=1